jgi:hypothetical protein
MTGYVTGRNQLTLQYAKAVSEQVIAAYCVPEILEQEAATANPNIKQSHAAKYLTPKRRCQQWVATALVNAQNTYSSAKLTQ